ncbi:hypothetical protein K1719_034499 [Acacia pycnantha]|nr:hypothetical protein K1719_034499 [Acacia pycnantha]
MLFCSRILVYYLCKYFVNQKIPLVIAGRRSGHAEIVYASTEKAERELKWTAKYGIEEMCRYQWNWASNNPYGYESQPQESTN